MALPTPGYTPTFEILKGGEDITGAFNDRALSITIESRRGGGDGDLCTIVLDDRDWLIAPIATDETATLAVALGYLEVGLFDQGTFEVNQVSYLGMPKSMQLICTSLGFTTAAKSPVITDHESKTVGAIVAEIAAAAGVQAAVTAGLSDKVIQFRNQHESAMHLLQDLERQYDGLAKFSDGKLSFTDRNSGLSVSGKSLSGFTLEPADLGPSWCITESNRTSYSKTRASYWDRVNHQLVWLESQITGADSNAPPFMIKRSFPSKDEAQAAADSKQSALNRGIRWGTLTLAKGNPSIKGGSPFQIANTRDGIDGDYIITTATHSFTKEGGLQTSLSFNSADVGTDAASFDALTDGSTTPDFTAQGQVYTPQQIDRGLGHN